MGLRADRETHLGIIIDRMVTSIHFGLWGGRLRLIDVASENGFVRLLVTGGALLRECETTTCCDVSLNATVVGVRRVYVTEEAGTRSMHTMQDLHDYSWLGGWMDGWMDGGIEKNSRHIVK